MGCVLPSCCIVTALAYVYYRFKGLAMVQGILFGLRPAVVAMIASSGVSLLLLAFYGQSLLPADPLCPDWVAVGLFAAAFFVLRRFKADPIWVMAGAGAAGVLLYSVL